MSRNLAASVRARLKQHAEATKQDFNLTLTHYGLERLLYRLSVSEHASNFLLKGALLFTLWYDVAHRPTRDADLLGFGPDDIDTAVSAFRKICQTPADDGVIFDPDSVNGSIIRKEAAYGGIRIDLQAKLDGARIALQVDIGFGDAVTPAPQAIIYPVLLEDFPAPQLRAYPKFQLNEDEFSALRLQFATLKNGRRQHRKYLPYVFTEHGAIMAATLLNSPRATALSVYVVRAFVELRGMLSSNRELATKVHQLERKVSVHERNIAELVDSMADLLATPPPPSKRPIGFVPQEEKPSKPMAAKGKAAVKKV